MNDAQEELKRARNTAMEMAGKARIPEAGCFSAIAQDLDWLCTALAAAPAQERIDALELEVRQLTEQIAELRHAPTPQADSQPAAALKITAPNDSGSAQCIVRWQIETPKGWIGAWNREALDYLLGRTPAESVPAIQGEMNVQLDIDSNHSAPGQQRDVARSVALGQPMGNRQDQAAGRPSAQGDKLLTVAERNIRSFLRSAQFKGESDREAALNCVDVLWAAARDPANSVLEDAAQLERERICAAIKAEDDYCVEHGDYMLDSDDCIKIARSEWVRPDYLVDAARKQGGA